MLLMPNNGSFQQITNKSLAFFQAKMATKNLLKKSQNAFYSSDKKLSNEVTKSFLKKSQNTF
jgi:hypothetical protein